MFYVDDDIEKIQTKTNLYIKQYGPEGALHLSYEIMQNAIDEGMDKDSPCKNIHVTVDTKNDKLTCEDDGRGLPNGYFLYQNPIRVKILSWPIRCNLRRIWIDKVQVKPL